jgi:hypothetical protein
MTYWADFISFDIAYSQETGETLNDAILIPSDDNIYLSENTQQFAQIDQVILKLIPKSGLLKFFFLINYFIFKNLAELTI